MKSGWTRPDKKVYYQRLHINDQRSIWYSSNTSRLGILGEAFLNFETLKRNIVAQRLWYIFLAQILLLVVGVDRKEGSCMKQRLNSISRESSRHFSKKFDTASFTSRMFSKLKHFGESMG